MIFEDECHLNFRQMKFHLVAKLKELKSIASLINH